VEAAPDLATWTTLTSTQAATTDAIETKYIDVAAAESYSKRFYEITRTALASYDPVTETTSSPGVSPTSGSRGTSVTLTITLNSDYNPPPPPDNVAPNNVTLVRSGASTITSGTTSRNSSTGVVTANLSIPSAATAGVYTVDVNFSGGAGTEAFSDAFTVK
jgi:hypothetical protein